MRRRARHLGLDDRRPVTAARPPGRLGHCLERGHRIEPVDDHRQGVLGELRHPLQHGDRFAVPLADSPVSAVGGHRYRAVDDEHIPALLLFGRVLHDLDGHVTGGGHDHRVKPEIDVHTGGNLVDEHIFDGGTGRIQEGDGAAAAGGGLQVNNGKFLNHQDQLLSLYSASINNTISCLISLGPHGPSKSYGQN